MYTNSNVMARAWVQYFQQAVDDAINNLINNIYINQEPITVTGNTTLTDEYCVVTCNSSSPIALTLPASDVMKNKFFIIYNKGAGVVTVTPVGSDTINDDATFGLNQFESVHIISNGTDWIIA
jgi:hypothetical protein